MLKLHDINYYFITFMLFIMFVLGNWQQTILQNFKNYDTEMQRIIAKSESFAIEKANEAQTVIQASNKWFEKQLKCMALNIFYEARGEPALGQAAVGAVVLNRIAHGFANDVCAVVYQYHVVKNEEANKKVCQFSWVCDITRKAPSIYDPSWRQAQSIAKDLMTTEKYKDVLNDNVLYFHSTSVQPNWNKKQAIKIGNHIFYSKPNKQQKT